MILVVPKYSLYKRISPSEGESHLSPSVPNTALNDSLPLASVLIIDGLTLSARPAAPDVSWNGSWAFSVGRTKIEFYIFYQC